MTTALLLPMVNCTSVNKNPEVIGHRGAMGHETENTIASVRKALDLGVDMIEIDVFKIKSGEIVVFHDVRVERLSNGVGQIEDYQLEDLKKLELTGNHRIPELHEILDVMEGDVRLNIELKGPDTAEKVDSIVRSYIENKSWALDRFLISSFNWDELRDMRAVNNKVPIAILIEGDPLQALPVAGELGAEAINPNFESLSANSVKTIQAEGYKVYTYTVNKTADIKRMKLMGVDGIITNFPERVR